MSAGFVVSGRAAAEADSGEAAGWRPVTRVLFRFGLVYFGLFAILTQVILELPGMALWWKPIGLGLPEPGVEWVGRAVFGVEVVRRDSGSGDTAYDWVLLFCILVTAAGATVVWSVLDRKRVDYRAAAGWSMVFLRVCLAATMLSYGIVKVFQLQMPSPSLARLVQPFGELTPMEVLWSQVGVSPVYESVLGATEILCGVLLLIPRTAAAGALATAFGGAQIWILNMTYDVPVKILSFNILLMALALAAPEARRIATVFLGNATGPSTAPRAGGTVRQRRVVATLQIVLLLWLLIAGTAKGAVSWQQRQDTPELYGIWEVATFVRDGESIAPLVGDENRWRRIIFDRQDTVTIQTMTDRFSSARAEFADGTLALHARTDADATPWATFIVERPTSDHLRLIGEANGHLLVLELTLRDPSAFSLRREGFHWVNEYPNNNCVSGRPACPAR
ncbi:DoxX family protein [Nocardia sp. NPDC057668]|uniref:DoxX family protein n=1 Tax=Nocardia sp. NPDC057668 TaxID=3346202 RepID=UPI003672516A